MRTPTLPTGIVAVLLLRAQTASAQDLPMKLEVTTAPTHTVWYADPMWIGIGGVALLLVIVLVVLASRRKSTTTVIR